MKGLDIKTVCYVVSIVTYYKLDGLGNESQWGARFYAPVQTGPGALYDG